MSGISTALPRGPEGAAAGTRSQAQYVTSRMRSMEEYTAWEPAEDIVGQLGRIQTTVHRNRIILENTLNKDVEPIRSALVSLQTAQEGSEAGLAELKNSVNNGWDIILLAMQEPLNVLKKTIENTRDAIVTLRRICISPDNTTWRVKSSETKDNTRRALKSFEVQIKEIHDHSNGLRLDFLEKYAKEVTTELFKVR